MRYTLTALMLAGALAVSGGAFAQSSSKPASKPASSSSTKPAATHSVQGTVKSVDASSLVITKSGKKGSDMTFKLDSTTQKEGSIATGTPVSVRYHVDGSTNVATAVNAEAPKSSKQAKK
ncbi:MAG TPA: hypothetical protein VFU28_05925 [Vicinamibacterales bacterium]|nr:hypothetical protein [Vicinamibacterales bacterium]